MNDTVNMAPLYEALSNSTPIRVLDYESIQEVMNDAVSYLCYQKKCRIMAAALLCSRDIKFERLVSEEDLLTFFNILDRALENFDAIKKPSLASSKLTGFMYSNL